jgi:hypothetical protein
MAEVEVRKGLRKLAFEKRSSGDESRRYVVVHFVVAEPLQSGQVASINLGVHDGAERVLRGIPRLLEMKESKVRDYVYCLEGEVD